MGNVRVRFDSFVNAGYAKGRSLPGLKTTARAIETTLGLWYEQAAVGQTVVDGTPGQLRQFLNNLPSAQECDISVVYIGSIQSPDGAVMFVNKQFARWQDIYRRKVVRAADPSVPGLSYWMFVTAGRCVMFPPGAEQFCTGLPCWRRGGRNEPINSKPVRLMPIDVQKHYPAAQGWAQTYLEPGWNRAYQFPGINVDTDGCENTFAACGQPRAGKRFFDACSQNAAIFCKSINHRWGSTVQTFFPSSGLSVSEMEK